MTNLELLKEEIAFEKEQTVWNKEHPLNPLIDEIAQRYAQQFQAPTEVLTTEIMVLRERNEELVEMLERAKSTIAVLKRSMLVHPDCELGSEFCDRTTDAQNLEDEIGELFNKVTNGN